MRLTILLVLVVILALITHTLRDFVIGFVCLLVLAAVVGLLAG